MLAFPLSRLSSCKLHQLHGAHCLLHAALVYGLPSSTYMHRAAALSRHGLCSMQAQRMHAADVLLLCRSCSQPSTNTQGLSLPPRSASGTARVPVASCSQAGLKVGCVHCRVQAALQQGKPPAAVAADQLTELMSACSLSSQQVCASAGQTVPLDIVGLLTPLRLAASEQPLAVTAPSSCRGEPKRYPHPGGERRNALCAWPP